MTAAPPRRRPTGLPAAFAIATLLTVLAVAPAAAQYKIVGPDGRVTYTDRPPTDAGGRVQSIGPGGGVAADAASNNPPLPAELQRIGARFPVTLYSSKECAPCDSGRQLLQQRGVPYAERQVLSADDVGALERLTGTRSLPALQVGGQVLRGYSQSDWSAYLDAAGYPTESRLPRAWAPPAPQPLVARTPAANPAPVARAPEAVRP
ncbi:MAG: glutaredoxin domain-containing protein, partial [Rubrivivax sp.]